MDEIEGSIHIQRLDEEGRPEPWTYDVAFTPYGGPGGSLPVRKLTGDDQLTRLLRDGVGVLPEFLEEALKQARAGHATVPSVRLTLEQKQALRL